MTKVYAIQTAPTVLEEQSRMDSMVWAPLTDQGALAVRDAARELAGPGLAITAVYACMSGEAERQTAELVAQEFHVKIRDSKDLHELDFGLWQGLTVAEIKRRQGRAYRQWIKAPASVRPPEGETLEEARCRLAAAIKDIAKRHKGASVVLVLRPVLMGLLQCIFVDESIDSLWQHVDRTFRWGCYDVDEQAL